MRRLPADKYQSVQEYSRDSGIVAELVRRYCRTGRLQAEKIGGRWVIKRGAKVEGYEPRLKDGTFVGMNDLRAGRIDIFLKKRGIII
jgi:hypothetical protein